MAFNLIDSVGSSVPAGLLDKVSGIIGESPQATQTGFRAGISSIIGGLKSQSATPQGAGHIYSTMKDGGFLSGGFDPSSTFGRGGGGLDQAMTKGHGLIDSLFGSRSTGMAEEISRTSGLKTGSASKLMALGAPLVLGVLGRKVGGGGVAGLTQLLHGPSEQYVEAGRTKREVLTPVASRSRWSRLLVPAAVALALLAGFNWLRHRPSRTDYTPQVTSQAPVKEEPAQPSAPTAQQPQPTTPAEEPGTGGAGMPSKPKMLGESATDLKQALTSKSALPQTFILSGVEFAPGSANLGDKAKTSLDNVASTLREYPNAKVTVEGHADATGEAAMNQQLSESRATAVKDALVQRGVSEDQLKTEALSSSDPLSTNDSSSGRNTNRLAQIVLEAR